MLRIAALIAVMLAFNIAAEEDTKRPRKLADLLALEDAAAFDNQDLSATEQIDAAKKRFYGYRDDVCKTPDDIKATKACFKRVLSRIIERARDKVREAEDLRERMIEQLRGKAVAT